MPAAQSTRNYAGDETAAPTTESTGATRPNTRSRTRTTESASSAAASDPALDPDTQRRTRQIEAEIQHTREEMAETVEALQERLRPSNVVADATDRVKTAASAKVKSMAETAGDTAQGVMNETRGRAYDVVEGARQNPIPALMIGAGVAWLLMDTKKGSNRHRSYESRYASSAFRSGEYYADESEPTYNDVEYTKPRTGGDGQALTARARSAAKGGVETARRTTYRTQNQLQRMMRENPLLIGAAAVVVGAAIGAALPETERENELMGEARESVVHRAQDVARNAASTAQDAVKGAAGEVAQRVVSETVGGGSISTNAGSSGSSGNMGGAGTTRDIGNTGKTGGWGSDGGTSGI